MLGQAVERVNDKARSGKYSMPWKPIVCLVAYLILFIRSGAYLLLDDNDQQGARKALPSCTQALSGGCEVENNSINTS